jgi:hypothetical protein
MDVTNGLNKRIGQFGVNTSPNSNRDIKVIVVDFDNADYEFKGIQSKLHYVKFDAINFDELIEEINRELTEQENILLGEKSTLIRRMFNEEICNIYGTEKSVRLISVMPNMMADPSKGYPCFGYAAIAVK